MSFELFKQLIKENSAADWLANQSLPAVNNSAKTFKWNGQRVTVSVDYKTIEGEVDIHDPTPHLQYNHPDAEDVRYYDFHMSFICFKVILGDEVFYVQYSFTPDLEFEDGEWLDFKTFEKGIANNTPEFWDDDGEQVKDKTKLKMLADIVQDYADDPRVLKEIIEVFADKKR